MPVIRVDDKIALPASVHDSLLERLKNEVEGQSTENGPVIFEIPLERYEGEGHEIIDVLVVWEEWRGVLSEYRSNLILEAYGDEREKIAQPLGVTYEEVVQQQLLPYTIVSMFEEDKKFLSLVCQSPTEKADKILSDVREAKRSIGGIVLPNGKLELRFPTWAMAESVCNALLGNEKYRDLYWRILPGNTSLGS